jgi:hypothetical protein
MATYTSSPGLPDPRIDSTAQDNPDPSAEKKWRTGDYAWRLVLIVLAVVLIRLAVLVFTPLDLFYDEAQYWFWGQNLALGYFSKPPLIAWIIAGTTYLCGDTEACVRASAPLFHGLTTLLIFGLGASIYPARTAFLAALGYLFAIGVAASSLLISTDVPLLTCWVIALWAFTRYVQNPGYTAAIIMGLAIAVGLNAKYAMVYFPLCVLLYLVFVSCNRNLLSHVSLWLGLIIGMLGFVPNLIWNMEHDFITFAHTGENITGIGSGLSLSVDPLSFLEFFGSQFGVAGPILFAAFLWIIIGNWRSRARYADTSLLFFCLPILLILGAQAFQASANYNWAATAFPALIIVTTAILIEKGCIAWVKANLYVCIACSILLAAASLAVLAVRPDNPLVAQTNLEDMFGWAEHAEVLDQRLDRLEPDVIVTVGRRYSAGFAYYLRHRDEPQRALHRGGTTPRNHFEFVAPWSGPAQGERAVIISPGNVAPVPGARLVAVVEADDGTARFRSNSYLFLVVGPEPVVEEPIETETEAPVES